MQIIKLYNRFLNKIYSNILKIKLKSCGKNFHISYPSTVIGLDYTSIGNKFHSHKRLRLEVINEYKSQSFSPELIIGDNVNINYDCHIGCINKIYIGNNVLIASRVFIADHSHGKIEYGELNISPSERNLYSKGPVIIEDNVWLGEGCSIMPGVTIGKNCVVGANSVVTKSFPSNCVIAGVPAKIIKLLEP